MQTLKVIPAKPDGRGIAPTRDTKFELNGHELHGVVSCDILFRIDDVVRAQVELLIGHETITAVPVFFMKHPLTGKRFEVSEIIDNNGERVKLT